MSWLKRWRHAPDDPRGGRLIAVIECVLNQNARDAGAASSPAMCRALLTLCAEQDVGILQLPCPELACLGPQRHRAPGLTLRAALEQPAARQICQRLADNQADRLNTAQACGTRILAIVGGNTASPGCAVHTEGDRLRSDAGVFMLALESALRERAIPAVFLPLRDADPAALQQDLQALARLLAPR